MVEITEVDKRSNTGQQGFHAVPRKQEEDSKADTKEDLQEVQAPANWRWSSILTELGEKQGQPVTYDTVEDCIVQSVQQRSFINRRQDTAMSLKDLLQKKDLNSETHERAIY